MRKNIAVHGSSSVRALVSGLSRDHRFEPSAQGALPFDFAVIFCVGRDPRPVAALQNRTANGAYLAVLDDLSFRLEEPRRQASYSLGGVVL
jgi:hypothetical protein